MIIQQSVSACSFLVKSSCKHRVVQIVLDSDQENQSPNTTVNDSIFRQTDPDQWPSDTDWYLAWFLLSTHVNVTHTHKRSDQGQEIATTGKKDLDRIYKKRPPVRMNVPCSSALPCGSFPYKNVSVCLFVWLSVCPSAFGLTSSVTNDYIGY